MKSATPAALLNIRVARRIVRDTPLLGAVRGVEYLPKGYSADRKYVLRERGRPRYLLRLSDIKLRRRRQGEFEVLGRLRRRGVLCPRGHLFGVVQEAKVCYMVLDYVLGRCAQEELGKLSRRRQFNIGVAAGRQLRKLHALRCPDGSFDWHAHRRAKYLRHVREARDNGITFPGRKEVERYVNGNFDLMRGRPARLQHDDFHPGNLIVRGGRLAGVIDFNRCDWGDPIHDFCKLPMFCAPSSVPFALGQLAGYFPGGIPGSFWPLYNLYVAMSLHGALLWSYFYDRRGWRRWQAWIQDILRTHDFAAAASPAWFGR